MKVKLLLIIILQLSTFLLSAQVNVGLSGGLSIIPGNSREAQLNLFIEKPFNKIWALQPEISYVNMKWERRMTRPGQLPYRFESLSKHLEIVCPIKGKFQINTFNLYSKMGLYTTYLTKLEGRILVEDGMETTIRKLKSIEETNLIQFDFGIAMALGFEYTVGQRHKVMTEISNRIGVLDTNTDEATDDFTHSFLLNIGIIYCFTEK